MPKASIIVPAYNAAAYISETLDSILAQTFQDFECLIIDDGSTDNTIEVVRKYNDSRIKLFQQENSGGPAKPRNRGLREASGDYIFMFDSDDIMLPDKVEKSVKALDAYPHVDMLFTNFSSIDEKNQLIKPSFLSDYDSFWNLIARKNEESGRFILATQDVYAALIKTNFIGTSSVVLRTRKIKNKFSFDEALSNADDYLFWVKFLKSHDAIYLNYILHQYRIQTNGISSRGYLKRGPSRIQALLRVRSDCEVKSLQDVLSVKLSKEYSFMAYAYKNEKNFKAQRDYSIRSLSEKINFTAMKLLVQSLILPCFSFK